MNHGELRTKVHEHFTEVLKKAKARRDELGPYTVLEKERIADAIRLHEADNEDFWDIMKKNYATQQYQSFCNASGIPQKQPINTQWAILDEIRKAWIGFHEAMLEHNKTFETYDFSTPPSAPASTPKSPEPTSGSSAAKVEKKPPEVPASPLLSVLFAKRKAVAEQTGQLSAKLLNDYQAWTDLFIELQGDRPILDYRKSDARDFKGALLELPTNRNKLPHTIGLRAREAIQAAKDHSLADTIRRHNQ